MTLPSMLKVPEASLLLRRPERTLRRQISEGYCDLPCAKKPPRVQTRAVLKLAGLSEEEAAERLAVLIEGVAA